MSDIYDLRLPTHIGDALLRLVGIAERHQLLTLPIRRLMTSNEYTVGIKDELEKISIEKEDFLPGLSALGFIVVVKDESVRGSIVATVFLTEKAYAWVRYRQRNALGRWWERATLWGKQTAPLLVGVAAIALTLLQILQTALSLLQ